MNSLHRVRHGLAALGTALLLAPAAFAAPPSTPAATYQKDRADCLAGNTNQSRHDCLYEAQSAYNEARSGKLRSDDPKTLMDNALQRCQVHPAGNERSACERMARGQGWTSGSVEDGGVLKELITVTPASDAPVKR